MSREKSPPTEEQAHKTLIQEASVLFDQSIARVHDFQEDIDPTASAKVLRTAEVIAAFDSLLGKVSSLRIVPDQIRNRRARVEAYNQSVKEKNSPTEETKSSGASDADDKVKEVIKKTEPLIHERLLLLCTIEDDRSEYFLAKARKAVARAQPLGDNKPEDVLGRDECALQIVTELNKVTEKDIPENVSRTLCDKYHVKPETLQAIRASGAYSEGTDAKMALEQARFADVRAQAESAQEYEEHVRALEQYDRQIGVGTEVPKKEIDAKKQTYKEEAAGALEQKRDSAAELLSVQLGSWEYLDNRPDLPSAIASINLASLTAGEERPVSVQIEGRLEELKKVMALSTRLITDVSTHGMMHVGHGLPDVIQDYLLADGQITRFPATLLRNVRRRIPGQGQRLERAKREKKAEIQQHLVQFMIDAGKAGTAITEEMVDTLIADPSQVLTACSQCVTGLRQQNESMKKVDKEWRKALGFIQEATIRSGDLRRAVGECDQELKVVKDGYVVQPIPDSGGGGLDVATLIKGDDATVRAAVTPLVDAIAAIAVPSSVPEALLDIATGDELSLPSNLEPIYHPDARIRDIIITESSPTTVVKHEHILIDGTEAVSWGIYSADGPWPHMWVLDLQTGGTACDLALNPDGNAPPITHGDFQIHVNTVPTGTVPNRTWPLDAVLCRKKGHPAPTPPSGNGQPSNLPDSSPPEPRPMAPQTIESLIDQEFNAKVVQALVNSGITTLPQLIDLPFLEFNNIMQRNGLGGIFDGNKLGDIQTRARLVMEGGLTRAGEVPAASPEASPLYHGEPESIEAALQLIQSATTAEQLYSIREALRNTDMWSEDRRGDRVLHEAVSSRVQEIYVNSGIQSIPGIYWDLGVRPNGYLSTGEILRELARYSVSESDILTPLALEHWLSLLRKAHSPLGLDSGESLRVTRLSTQINERARERIDLIRAERAYTEISGIIGTDGFTPDSTTESIFQAIHAAGRTDWQNIPPTRDHIAHALRHASLLREKTPVARVSSPEHIDRTGLELVGKGSIQVEGPPFKKTEQSEQTFMSSDEEVTWGIEPLEHPTEEMPLPRAFVYSSNGPPNIAYAQPSVNGGERAATYGPYVLIVTSEKSGDESYTVRAELMQRKPLVETHTVEFHESEAIPMPTYSGGTVEGASLISDQTASPEDRRRLALAQWVLQLDRGRQAVSSGASDLRQWARKLLRRGVGPIPPEEEIRPVGVRGALVSEQIQSAIQGLPGDIRAAMQNFAQRVRSEGEYVVDRISTMLNRTDIPIVTNALNAYVSEMQAILAMSDATPDNMSERLHEAASRLLEALIHDVRACEQLLQFLGVGSIQTLINGQIGQVSGKGIVRAVIQRISTQKDLDQNIRALLSALAGNDDTVQAIGSRRELDSAIGNLSRIEQGIRTERLDRMVTFHITYSNGSEEDKSLPVRELVSYSANHEGALALANNLSIRNDTDFLPLINAIKAARSIRDTGHTS